MYSTPRALAAAAGPTAPDAATGTPGDATAATGIPTTPADAATRSSWSVPTPPAAPPQTAAAAPAPVDGSFGNKALPASLAAQPPPAVQPLSGFHKPPLVAVGNGAALPSPRPGDTTGETSPSPIVTIPPSFTVAGGDAADSQHNPSQEDPSGVRAPEQPQPLPAQDPLVTTQAPDDTQAADGDHAPPPQTPGDVQQTPPGIPALPDGAAPRVPEADLLEPDRPEPDFQDDGDDAPAHREPAPALKPLPLAEPPPGVPDEDAVGSGERGAERGEGRPPPRGQLHGGPGVDAAVFGEANAREREDGALQVAHAEPVEKLGAAPDTQRLRARGGRACDRALALTTVAMT